MITTSSSHLRNHEGLEASSYIPLHDEVLMQLIQHKDSQALDLLFQRYRILLKSVVLRVVHDHASADDVVQECMMEIWQHADHYSPDKGKALGWIVTLSKRRAIDHLRRRQAYSHARERMQDETLTQHYGSQEDAAAECERSDLGHVLVQHLSRLPVHQQQVIRLGFLKGMSQREIALSTQTPLGTVKTRMELGLKKLRTAFRSPRTSDALRLQNSF